MGYSFYEQLIKEINKIDYNRIKLLYQYYNPSSLETQKNFMEKNQQKNFFDLCKFYFQNLKIQKLTNKLFKPLISTTERVVDLVLSVILLIFSYFYNIYYIFPFNLFNFILD